MKKIVFLITITLAVFSFSLQAQNSFAKLNPSKGNNGYKMAIEPQFDNVALDFSEGVACVMIRHGQLHTYIDATGKPISSETFQNIRPFSNGRAAVERDHKWGYIDRNGKIVIPIEYGSAGDFNEGLALVRVDVFGDGKYYRSAFIDTMGNTFGTQISGYASSFSEGHAPIQGKDGLWMVIGKRFVRTSPTLPYDNIDEFHEGLARVRIGEKCGFIDTLGNIVIAPKEIGLDERFYEGLCLVKMNDKFGYMDKKGNIVIPCKYTYAEHFSCGRAIVSESTKRSEALHTIEDGFGVIDRDGNYVVKPNTFDYYVGPYSEGLVIVGSPEGKVGFIDVNGKVVIPMIFQRARPFHNGFAAVRVDGKWGFIQITD